MHVLASQALAASLLRHDSEEHVHPVHGHPPHTECNAQHWSIAWTHSLLLLQNEDKTSRGFGFVNYEQVDSAQKAVEALNGKQMEDKELYVGRAQKKTEREAALKQRSAHNSPAALLV